MMPMKAALPAACAMAALVVGCGKPSQSAPPPPRAPSAVDAALGTLGRAQQTAVKTVDLAALKQAIEMFQVDKDRLPKDLNELVAAGYLPALPQPPTGLKIEYDPATGQVRMVKR